MAGPMGERRSPQKSSLRLAWKLARKAKEMIGEAPRWQKYHGYPPDAADFRDEFVKIIEKEKA